MPCLFYAPSPPILTFSFIIEDGIRQLLPGAGPGGGPGGAGRGRGAGGRRCWWMRPARSWPGPLIGPSACTTPRPTPRFWPCGKGPGSGGITGCRGQAFMLPWNLVSCAWEPCWQARVRRLVFGAPDPKGGACVSLYRLPEDTRLNHRLEVTGGVREAECRELVQEFFQGPAMTGKGAARRPVGGRRTAHPGKLQKPKNRKPSFRRGTEEAVTGSTRNRLGG